MFCRTPRAVPGWDWPCYAGQPPRQAVALENRTAWQKSPDCWQSAVVAQAAPLPSPQMQGNMSAPFAAPVNGPGQLGNSRKQRSSRHLPPAPHGSPSARPTQVPSGRGVVVVSSVAVFSPPPLPSLMAGHGGDGRTDGRRAWAGIEGETGDIDE